MDQAELGRLLDEGFALWQRVVGHDPTQRVFNYGSWSIEKQAEDLQEARRLDTTGLTAFMLLKAYTHTYLADKDQAFTALDIIRGLTPEQQARLDLLRALHDYLQRPAVDAVLEQFITSVRLATEHYGIDHGDREAWLTDYRWMAVLRRDALRSFELLEAHQFFHGRPGGSPRVVYTTKVMEFWNIPSLVRAMQSQGLRGGRGITLCLIRDPAEALHSFFVLAVVNGESITVLTDRGEQAHPMAKEMSRRPDKEFAQRAYQQWFPYELVKVQQDEERKRLYAEARKAIVPINAQAVELADFSRLHPADAIWLSLLFELIRWKYLEENLALPEASYTAEMVKQPLLLLAARQAIVSAEPSTYRPLEAPRLTRADVTAETTAEQWQRPPVGHNEWMIERYGAEVPEDALNPLGAEERNAVEALPELALAASDGPRWMRQREPVHALRHLDPLSFGTEKAIRDDRLWTARYNQCVIVQKRAFEEYRRTRREVDQWLQARARARRDWFIETAVRGELIVAAQIKESCFDTSVGAKPTNIVHVFVGTIAQNRQGDYGYGHFWPPRHAVQLSEASHGSPFTWYCAVTGAAATSYHARFVPRDPESIALLLGCAVADLPWQLRRWAYDEEPRYVGNSILDRLDPSDWVLHNPWSELGSHHHFRICVALSLSRRPVNEMRKRLSLPPIDWSIPGALDDPRRGQEEPGQ